MLASIPMIIGVASTIMQGVQTAIQFGKDAKPAYDLLRKLFAKEKITVEEVESIRAQNDALNAEIEGQTEAG